jgi:membrane-bound lytic murein transglycosylase B
MGQCQFMPSSYLSYAVDYNNDGIRDIWHSKQDAIASAANYLAQNGWNPANSSITRIHKIDDKYVSNCKKKNICDYKNDLSLIFVKNHDIVTDTFAVGKNYHVLMKWNRSDFFVLSILTIADKIKMAG